MISLQGCAVLVLMCCAVLLLWCAVMCCAVDVVTVYAFNVFVEVPDQTNITIEVEEGPIISAP